MNKRRPKQQFREIKQREPDANALDARMINPAKEPVLPDILNTARSPADLNAEFTPPSAPLGEEPHGEAQQASSATPAPQEKPEFFNPSAPLEEKPKKFAAVHSRPKSRMNRPVRPAEAPRKPARRSTR